jgi:hypothetical protein
LTASQAITQNKKLRYNPERICYRVKALVGQYCFNTKTRSLQGARTTGGRTDLLSTNAERKPLEIKRIERGDCTLSKKSEQYRCRKKASRKGSMEESKVVQRSQGERTKRMVNGRNGV